MSDLDPVRRPGELAFVVADEGVAGELGPAYDYVAAWITLRVDSTVEQVGQRC